MASFEILSCICFQVMASPDRKFATWLGGSLIAESPGFSAQMITKHQYECNGPAIVHVNCCSKNIYSVEYIFLEHILSSSFFIAEQQTGLRNRFGKLNGGRVSFSSC